MSKNLLEMSTALSAPASSPVVPRRRPLHVPKAPEIVAARIRKRIVSGELKEGDLLPSESHLMEDFCVSRPTIREAFRILEAERLISVARGARGGAFINSPDPELIRSYTLLVLQVAQTTVNEIFDTRRLLEPPIARELALKNSPEAIRDLRACLAQEVAAMGDPLAFAAAVASFHRMLVVLSGNKPLIHLMDTITGVVELYQGMSMARDAQGLSIQEKRPQIERAMKSQRKLIDLIEQGKAPEAEEHWRKHMEVSHRNWIQGYEGLTIQKLMAEKNQL